MAQKLKDVDSLEDRFKSWIESTASTGTANSYWDRISDFKYFKLREASERKISGRLNKNIDSTEKKTAVSQFIQFLYEEWEKDKVRDENYEDLRYKKNAIKSNLELDRKERNRDKDIDVKRHYLHKDELIKLLKELGTDRARLCLLLYYGGFRIGEIKRLTKSHLRPGYGEHGAIKVPGKKTSSGYKSEDPRTVKFRSGIPLQLFQEAPTGSWKDENGKTWDKVFFPDNYAQLINYHLEKQCNSVGLTPRTSHSFRHIRITDLIQATDLSHEEVQDRSGHQRGSKVTNNYAETSFDRKPETLENYTQELGIKIKQIIKE